MFRKGSKAGRYATAAAALAATAVAVVVPETSVSAAELDAYATGWVVISGNPVADFFPPYATPGNASGASDDLCQDSTFASNVFEFTFGSLPVGSTINGIEVTIDAGIGGGDSPDVTLTDGSGADKSDTKNFTPPSQGPCSATTDNVLGGPTDDWNTTLNAADLTAGNFGVKIAGAIFMDSINFKVYFGNSAPTAEANGPYSVPEGASVALSSAGSSDPDGDTLTIDWDLDDNGSFETSGRRPCSLRPAATALTARPIAVRVSDGSLDDTDTATVNITNVAPTIDTIGVSAASIDEGDSVTVSGTFSDPGSGETYTGDACGATAPRRRSRSSAAPSRRRDVPRRPSVTGTASDTSPSTSRSTTATVAATWRPRRP